MRSKLLELWYCGVDSTCCHETKEAATECYENNAKPVSKWICVVCSEPHDTQQEAEECCDVGVLQRDLAFYKRKEKGSSSASSPLVRDFRSKMVAYYIDRLEKSVKWHESQPKE
jgi:hypothetical protein